MVRLKQITAVATVLALLSCGVVFITVLTGERIEGEGRMATAKQKLMAISTNFSRAVDALGTAAEDISRRKEKRWGRPFGGLYDDRHIR